MLIVLSLVFIGIIAFEAPRLFRQKMWRELGAFAGLMFIAMALSYAEALDIKLPTPIDAIEFVFKPVAEVIDKALK